MISIYKNNDVNSTENGEVKSIEFRGLSTDTKPIEINGKKINNGSIFIEIDSGDVYLYDSENQEWHKI